MGSSRKENFKIGCFHGKLDPGQDSEARIRNDIYLVGKVEIETSKEECIPIKIIAFELPLEKKNKRNICIDLLGYDNNFSPYIIELKKKHSNEKIEKIIKQIRNYGESFSEISENIEREIQERYFWKNFKFQKGVGKVILSSRSFFKNKAKTIESYKTLGIYVCSYANLKEDLNILKKCGSKGVVRLKIENR